MFKGIYKIFVVILIFSCVNGHLMYWDKPDQLQPVHGLFVKPSSDGTTGDLYVAASEDSGVRSQWLTDQPINFLPATTATQPHQAAVPVAFTSSITANTSPHDETLVTTQKRAVFTSPTIKYTYAYPLPATPNDANTITYPYTAIPSSNTPTNTDGSSSQCSTDVSTNAPPIPHYSPFHYFYPQMISSAFTNAMNFLKDAGNSDVGSSVMSHSAPMWSPAAYTYPVQYVMVDPNTWAQNQASSITSATSTTATNPTANENSKTK